MRAICNTCGTSLVIVKGGYSKSENIRTHRAYCPSCGGDEKGDYKRYEDRKAKKRVVVVVEDIVEAPREY